MTETKEKNANNSSDRSYEEPKPETSGSIRSGFLRRTTAVISMIGIIFSSVAFMQKYFCIPYSFDENRAIMLHKEPENTIDVLLIGSSTTYTGFSSVYAYERFGYTSFPYALAGSTCTMWKPAVQDALTRQSPKLIVVDVFGGGYSRKMIEQRNNQIYTIMSHTRFSAEKISTARELSSNVNNTSTISLLFPFLKYHNSIPHNLKNAMKSIKVHNSDFSPLKGLSNTARKRKLAAVDRESFTDEPVSLDKNAEEIIRDFMDYCKSNDLNVLFLKYPTVLTNKYPNEMLVNSRSNAILDIAREYGFPTLNMQKRFHEIGLKEREDYYNHGHTNIYGAKKITEFLGTYIQEEMGIGPSDLSNSDKKAWDECIPYYHAYMDLSKILIKKGNSKPLGDSPELTRDLKSILYGASIEEIAEKYYPSSHKK